MQRMQKLFHLQRPSNKKPTTSINEEAEPLPTTSPGDPDMLKSDEAARQRADEQWRNRIKDLRPSLSVTVQQVEELTDAQRVFTKTPQPKTRAIFCCFTRCYKKSEDNEDMPLVGLKN